MFDTEKLICEIEARPPLYDVHSKDYSNREIKAKCWAEIGKAMYNDWENSELSVKEKDEPVKDLMKRWKSLRDCFMRDHRSAMTSGTGKAAYSKNRYVYYEQLQFILPYVKGNQNTSSNIDPPTQKQSSSNVIAEEDSGTAVQNTLNDSGNNNIQSVNDTNTSEASTSNCNVAKKPSTKRKFENPNVVAGKRTAIERSVASSAKELTNILAANLEMQREERLSDKYGHKAFLLSFALVLDNMSLHESMLLRGQISQIFTNYFHRQETPSTSHSPMSHTPTTRSESDIMEEFSISDYVNLY